MSEKPPLPAELIAEIDRLAPQLTMLDHYSVLGVADSASTEELRTAYLRMLQRFHPGRWQAREGSAHHKRMEAIFARATEAYEVLRRPERKLDYDRALSKVRGVPRASNAPGAVPVTVIAPARTERRAPSAAALASAARLVDRLRPNEAAPLPAAPTPAPEITTPQVPAAPGHALILVVEDDETLRNMVARILGELGEVHAAADGREALTYLASASPLPRLVVTDVMMPHIDGLELARRLKADPRTDRIPIVMLTAKQGAKDLIDGVNAGARLYLTKPFKVDELKAKAKKAMGLR